ncbi:MAG: glycosyltransferase family 2 protein [Bacteroidetes bacterium]|nr:glycosyltransferase family 2 protein [Bacteroidota bacterium]
MLEITVAICTYNREKYLNQLFDSILAQTFDANCFEVILVNNNSPGNTKEIFSSFCSNNPKIQGVYSEELNQGLSYARNKAISLARAPLITFLDDDAFIEKGYLEKCTKTFALYPQLGAVGGKILLHYESIIPIWENKYLNSLLGYFNLGENSFFFSKKNYPRGSNMSFNTNIFQKVGNFNTSLGRTDKSMIGGEEKELFDRIYKANIEVLYDPQIIVYHCVPVERTTSEFIRRQAIGAGMSERIRTRTDGVFSFVLRILKEIYLWAASIILWIFFSVKLQFAKGNMIIAFRWWLTQGLLGWKKE